MFLDPVLLGRYPEDVLADLARPQRLRLRARRRPGDDLDAASMLGINYYSRHVVAAGNRRARERLARAGGVAGQRAVRFVSPGVPVTAMGWEIDAAGLTEILQRGPPRLPARRRSTSPRTAPPSTTVAAGRRGPRHRPIALLDAHLRACHERSPPACRCGATSPGRCWTTSSGPGATPRRFGLVYVDYATQRAHAEGQRALVFGRDPTRRPRGCEHRGRARPRSDARRAARRWTRSRRRAGVGRGTVSRVVNGSPQVADARASPCSGHRGARLCPQPRRPGAGDPAHRLGRAGRLRVGGAGLRRAVLRRHHPRDQLSCLARTPCSCGSRWRSPTRSGTGSSST